MTGKTHISIGVAASFCAADALGIMPGAEYIAAAAVGSMLPDIDHPGGMLNRKILPASNGIDKLVIYVILAFLSGYLYMKNSGMGSILYIVPIFLIVAFSKHRGVTHSMLGSVVFAYAAYKIGFETGRESLAFPFAIGYVLHIVADIFNSGGVQLFYPAKKRISLLKAFKSGSAGEKTLFLTFSLLAFYMAFKVYFG
ncbi:hypothetical protein EAL2_c17830 [Peptoclostridium acidaminophilum DSM 3953]|uniref:Membrane-bound metal-dependent hydrolase n=1 Tax=Peptoclostridium acidaminophilum DSM 3953 TaxID=1286171 RepID=W8T872_PEPAC|nr:metal-dependent hydrolase [Peptoclostridium acidaminophilum]AHM57075.1 hypothetical protein EAL2_c17830 [Peptoclostridium acidaminophilum DSM 3953]